MNYDIKSPGRVGDVNATPIGAAVSAWAEGLQGDAPAIHGQLSWLFVTQKTLNFGPSPPCSFLLPTTPAISCFIF